MAQVFVSTLEFAQKTGISPSTVTKWLRSGKLKGRKEGSKWLVSADQMPGHTATEATLTSSSSPPPQPVTATPATAEGAYSVDEFSALTYLTPFGVQKWLKEGRLAGKLDASGRWRVDAANLEDPRFKRLLRK